MEDFSGHARETTRLTRDADLADDLEDASLLPSLSGLLFSNLSDHLESTSHAHVFNQSDQERLKDAESIDYLAPSSKVYKDWLARQVARHWDRWVVMALVGVTMGIVGFSLHLSISILSTVKYQTTRWLLYYTRSLFVSWVWNVAVSTTLVYASAWLVVTVAPDAAGSGVPHLIAYLNGCDVPRLFDGKTGLVKYLSAILAVSSGLAVGPEGPVMVVGGILAAGISQLPYRFFRRFQNPTDKRNFVTAGAAVGVATAFSAPVGGLLFMFEELASFWQQSLGWQVFFACMVSVFTADTLHSGISALKEGKFGLFDDEASTVYFEVQTQLATHAMAMIPAAVVGLISGLAAIGFTVCIIELEGIIGLDVGRAAAVRHDELDSHSRFARSLVRSFALSPGVESAGDEAAGEAAQDKAGEAVGAVRADRRVYDVGDDSAAVLPVSADAVRDYPGGVEARVSGGDAAEDPEVGIDLDRRALARPDSLTRATRYTLRSLGLSRTRSSSTRAPGRLRPRRFLRTGISPTRTSPCPSRITSWPRSSRSTGRISSGTC